MQDAGRLYDDVSRDIGRTHDDDVNNDAGRTSNGSSTDESRTDVRRKSDVERVELSRRCGDGGRRRYTTAPRNAAVMAGSIAARSVVAALAGNALQLAAFFRHCCNNALDVKTLLRWPATRWTSQHCCDGRQRAGPRSVLLRCPAARWASQRCCDVRQRARPRSFAAMSDSATTPANAALQRFCFCFFFVFFFFFFFFFFFYRTT